MPLVMFDYLQDIWSRNVRHLDSRSNANVPIESYKVLSVIVGEIFTVKICIPWTLTYILEQRQRVSMPIESRRLPVYYQ